MSATSSATLIGLLVAVVQGEDILVLTHDASPKYSRTEYETACGSMVLRVRFGSGPDEHGRVEHLIIDGRSIPEAAEALQIRAARRVITGIDVLGCEKGSGRSVLQGVIKFEPGESRRLGMRWLLAFHLVRKDHKGWQITID